MRIIAVDPFYLRMPTITDAADGQQDTILVRVRTDAGIEGWGESDASPLVSMAAYCCPMSHGNIINIRQSLLGESINSPDDVVRLHAKALRNGLDIQQIHHAYSAADIALWDIVGKKAGVPVYRLLSDGRSHAKLPYASVLFGDTPEETRLRAMVLRDRGFQAAKFGWGPMGKHGEENDIALVQAAREGMGDDAQVMIDAGVVWGEDAATAYRRSVAFREFRPTWLEEPLRPDAIDAYADLAAMNPPVPIAAGEGAGNLRQAQDIISNGRVQYCQIDVGRIGGVTPAYRVRTLAEDTGIVYVNHTYKSHLSVAASLHVFATNPDFRLAEYPAAESPLSANVASRVERGADGLIRAPEQPGIGVTVDLDVVRQYYVPVRIEAGGDVLGFGSPDS
ncbi:mandelate racemase/muconate lactonizing enzyme family protein [Candidatus Poribacteria bacterium]|nr:mandelate racemase/muconate lactonizing enzyme family protein [Candidatus Poribacteria bacterium]